MLSLRVGGHLYIAPMQWQTLRTAKPSPSESQRLSAHRKHGSAYTGIVTKSGSAVGVLTQDQQLKLQAQKQYRKLAQRSLMAALCRLHGSALHAYADDSGVITALWIIDGLPAGEGDYTFQTSEDFIDFVDHTVVPTSPQDLQYHGVSEVFDGSDIDRAQLNHWTMATLAVAIGDSPRATKIVTLNGLRLRKLLTVATPLAGLVLFGFWRLDSHQASELAEQNAQVLETQKRQKVATRDANTIYLNAMSNFSDQASPSALVNGVIEVVGGIYATYRGWQLTSIVCTAKTLTCALTWENLGGGQNVSITNLYGQYRLDYQPDGNKIAMEVDFLLKREELKPEQSDELPSKYAFYNTVLAPIQHLEQSGLFTYSSDSKSSRIVSPFGDDMLVRNFEIQGVKIYYLAELAAILAKNSFRADVLEITYNRNDSEQPAKWMLRGRYAYKI